MEVREHPAPNYVPTRHALRPSSLLLPAATHHLTVSQCLLMGPATPMPKIVTASLLSYLRSHPTLPPQTWYYISAVALSAINRPEEIGVVFRDAMERVTAQGEEQRQEEQIRVARRMREALVKGGVIGGLPKVSD